MLPNKDFDVKINLRGKKISATMKARKIDNFKKWRDAHRVHYAVLPKNGDLAEYIGMVLGDGNIEKCSRTERIVIVGDSRKPQFIERYALMTESLFKKKPVIEKVSAANALRISLYQKFISVRLGIPTGSKKELRYILPPWIKENEAFLVRFLRGLYEAEASLSIHLPTCTYNFSFSNYNPFLLNIVDNALRRLEFHPEVRNNAIRIRKKAEVDRLKNLLQFRQY